MKCTEDHQRIHRGVCPLCVRRPPADGWGATALPRFIPPPRDSSPSKYRADQEAYMGSADDAAKPQRSLLSLGGLPRRVKQLLATLAVAGLCFTLLASGPLSAASCARIVPRLISHRGYDADQSPSLTLSTIQDLIDSGIGSFDVDLWWSSDRPDLFVGHPPSLRALWKLASDLPDTPFAVVSAASVADVAPRERGRQSQLVSLEELLGVLRAKQSAIGQVSLELKFTARPEWGDALRRLYRALAASGVPPHKLALVVESSGQAAVHRAAQREAGTRVALLGLTKDQGAAKGADGEPHADMAVLAAGASLFDGWSVSVSETGRRFEHGQRGLARGPATQRGWAGDRYAERASATLTLPRRVPRSRRAAPSRPGGERGGAQPVALRVGG